MDMKKLKDHASALHDIATRGEAGTKDDISQIYFQTVGIRARSILSMLDADDQANGASDDSDDLRGKQEVAYGADQSPTSARCGVVPKANPFTGMPVRPMRKDLKAARLSDIFKPESE